MGDDLAPEWPSDDWMAFVLGLDHHSRRVVAAFDKAAWNATPLLYPDAADPALLDFLLGLDVFARRITDLLEQCAYAADPPTSRAPSRSGDEDLLR